MPRSACQFESLVAFNTIAVVNSMALVVGKFTLIIPCSHAWDRKCHVIKAKGLLNYVL